LKKKTDKGEDIQLVFLRDFQKRAAQTPPSPSSPAQSGQIPGTESPSGGALPLEALNLEALKKNLPEPLQAIDMFSKMFFATPLF